MRQVQGMLLASLGMALILLEIPFLNFQAWLPAAMMLLLVVAWGVALWRRSRGFNLAFLALAALAVYATTLPFPAVMPLAALTLSLVAWDLSEFQLRLEEFEPQPDAQSLTRRHLERVSIVAGIGFLLGGLALLLRLRLRFEVAVLLGLLIFFGLAQTIRFLRSLSD